MFNIPDIAGLADKLSQIEHSLTSHGYEIGKMAEDFGHRIGVLESKITSFEAALTTKIEAAIKTASKDAGNMIGKAIDEAKHAINAEIAEIEKGLRQDLSGLSKDLDALNSSVQSDIKRITTIEEELKTIPDKVRDATILYLTEKYQDVAGAILTSEVAEPVYMTSVFDEEVQQRLKMEKESKQHDTVNSK